MVLRVEGWQAHPRPSRSILFLVGDGGLNDDLLVVVVGAQKKGEEDESSDAENQIASCNVAETEGAIKFVCLARISIEVAEVYGEESHDEMRQRRKRSGARASGRPSSRVAWLS